MDSFKRIIMATTVLSVLVAAIAGVMYVLEIGSSEAIADAAYTSIIISLILALTATIVLVVLQLGDKK